MFPSSLNLLHLYRIGVQGGVGGVCMNQLGVEISRENLDVLSLDKKCIATVAQTECDTEVTRAPEKRLRRKKFS